MIDAETNVFVGPVIKLIQTGWLRKTRCGWVPSDTALKDLLVVYSPEIVNQSVLETADRVSNDQIENPKERWLDYCQRVAARLVQEVNP